MGTGASSDRSVTISRSSEFQRQQASNRGSFHSNGINAVGFAPNRATNVTTTAGSGGTSPTGKLPIVPSGEDLTDVKLNPLDKRRDGVWEYLSASESLTGKWVAYSEDVNARLEAALKDGKTDAQVVLNGTLFTISFRDLTQKGHGGSKTVRRVLKASDGTLLTPERVAHRTIGDPFATQEADSSALFASPSATQFVAAPNAGSSSCSLGVDGDSKGSEDLDDASTAGFDHITGRQRAVLHSTIVAHTEAVYGVNFNVDGDKIITGSRDGTCKYWESSTSFLIANCERHPGSVLSAVLCKGKQLAATGCDDDVARVFNVAKGGSGGGENVVEAVKFEGHTHKVYTVNFLDTNTLLTGAMDNDVRLWDITKGVCTRVITAHDSSVFYTSVAPRSKQLALSASDDCTLAWHDFRLPDTVVARFCGHERTLWGCDIRFDEGQFVSCGMDCKVMLWDPRKTDAALSVFTAHRTPIHSVEYMPDGTGILSAARDHTFKIMECQRGQTVLSIMAHDGNVFRATYNAASNMVMTCGADAKVKLWSLRL